ncbi:MAG: UvrD-helicase domain-containing protein [Lachnospiraceae bacterium]|nr:UvrD-helicase domain-containing protein [Lachnospiraceae bacterium]
MIKAILCTNIILIMRFNQSQSRAIDHFRGPSLVLAGPGSGKTAVITYRVKNLIKKYHIPPCKILVLTFSKAAAREMEERFFSLQTTDVKKENRPVFGTFHGFFFSVLRSVENNGQKKVLSSAKKRILLQEECIRLHIDQ